MDFESTSVVQLKSRSNEKGSSPYQLWCHKVVEQNRICG